MRQWHKASKNQTAGRFEAPQGRGASARQLTGKTFKNSLSETFTAGSVGYTATLLHLHIKVSDSWMTPFLRAAVWVLWRRGPSR